MSNLLQKASIITTPTAYDTGKILSVKPVQYYGPELVTNGDFSNGINSWQGTDASSLLSVVLGELKIENGDGSSAGANSSITTEIGKEYRITFVSNKGTAVEGVFFGAGTSTNSVNLLDVTDNFDGIHTETFTATTTITWFIAKTLSTVNGQFSYIDNVSVKEVINADFDFTRNSSATRVGSNGLIQDVASNLPRIDYTGGVGSWKFEPQRTNLLPYSEDFTNWSVTNATLTENATISPDGTLNATKITDNATSGNHRVITPTTTPTSGNATYSIFLKKGTMTTCFINMFSGGTIANTFVDLENGTISGGSGLSQTIEPYGNDWYRVSITGVLANSSTYVYVYVKQIGGYVGAEDHIFMYGAQLEEGSFPTSYIRSNSGSVTTRLADVANNAGSSDLINSTEGVLYAEISALADDGTPRYLSISDGSFTNRVSLYLSSTTNRIGSRIVVGGSSVFLNASNQTQENNNKIAIKWKLNDYKFYINGVEAATYVLGGTFPASTLSEISFNDGGSGTAYLYSNTKCVAVFKEALTDLELECLVSWMSFSDLGINFGYTVE